MAHLTDRSVGPSPESSSPASRLSIEISAVSGGRTAHSLGPSLDLLFFADGHILPLDKSPCAYRRGLLLNLLHQLLLLRDDVALRDEPWRAQSKRNGRCS